MPQLGNDKLWHMTVMEYYRAIRNHKGRGLFSYSAPTFLLLFDGHLVVCTVVIKMSLMVYLNPGGHHS